MLCVDLSGIPNPISNGSPILASGAWNSIVILWNVAKKAKVHTFTKAQKGFIYSAKFSPGKSHYLLTAAARARGAVLWSGL